MLTGAVFSTRAISTSAGRGSPFGGRGWIVSDVSNGFGREMSRGMGQQLMVNVLAVERHFD
jgi:hypothetical protein